ncbi:MAG: hypothetical protein QE263_00840 [Vampirovibrionales bacterium]|nr:hypothetical protein [Vampirovibrionales bacterium]
MSNISNVSSNASAFSAKSIRKELTKEQNEALREMSKNTVHGDADLAAQLAVLSVLEFNTLAGTSSADTETITINNDTSVSMKEKKGTLDKIKEVFEKFKSNVQLAKDEIKLVKTFIKDLQSPADRSDEPPALMGFTQEEYAAVKGSKRIQMESGETDEKRKYAVMTGVETGFLESLRKDLKSGLFNIKNPKIGDFQAKVKEYEGKANKSTEDYEKLLGYRYIVDNWTEMNKSGGKANLSKANLKNLDKQGGKDGFVTLGDIDASKGQKQGYHSRKVTGIVTAAVVGTAITVLTGGALGPVAAGAIGAAAGSVASSAIQKKTFKEAAKEAALAAALGAVGGVAAQGAGAAASGLTSKMSSEVAKAAIKQGASAAARSASTTVINDVADDGKLNNRKGYLKQIGIGAVTGAAASGLGAGLGDFGATVVGKSIERGAQQGMDYAAKDLTDGKKGFDEKALLGAFAGGVVSGAVEQGAQAVGNHVGPETRFGNSPVGETVKAGLGGLAAGAAGELTNQVISRKKGQRDTESILNSALGSMQSNAVAAHQESRAERKAKQEREAQLAALLSAKPGGEASADEAPWRTLLDGEMTETSAEAGPDDPIVPKSKLIKLDDNGEPYLDSNAGTATKADWEELRALGKEYKARKQAAKAKAAAANPATTKAASSAPVATTTNVSNAVVNTPNVPAKPVASTTPAAKPAAVESKDYWDMSKRQRRQLDRADRKAKKYAYEEAMFWDPNQTEIAPPEKTGILTRVSDKVVNTYNRATKGDVTYGNDGTAYYDRSTTWVKQAKRGIGNAAHAVGNGIEKAYDRVVNGKVVTDANGNVVKDGWGDPVRKRPIIDRITKGTVVTDAQGNIQTDDNDNPVYTRPMVDGFKKVYSRVVNGKVVTDANGNVVKDGWGDPVRKRPIIDRISKGKYDPEYESYSRPMVDGFKKVYSRVVNGKDVSGESEITTYERPLLDKAHNVGQYILHPFKAEKRDLRNPYVTQTLSKSPQTKTGNFVADGSTNGKAVLNGSKKSGNAVVSGATSGQIGINTGRAAANAFTAQYTIYDNLPFEEAFEAARKKRISDMHTTTTYNGVDAFPWHVGENPKNPSGWYNLRRKDEDDLTYQSLFLNYEPLETNKAK